MSDPFIPSTKPRRAAEPPPKNWRRIIVIIVGAILIVSGLALGTWVYKFGGVAGSGASAATSPELAVHGFLTALAASDANEALTYASADPQSKKYLTSEILSNSRANYPMTNIVVARTEGQQVTANLKIGGEPVSMKFETVAVGLIYRVANVATEIKITGRVDVVPFNISNQTATETSIFLFPGRYDLSTSAKHLGYKENQLLVTNPGGIQPLNLTPQITESGVKAVTAAAKAQLQKCLASTTVTPEGCLVQFDPPPGVTLLADGIRYSLAGDDPTDKLDVVWDQSKPGVLKLPVSFDIRVVATAADGKTYSATEHFSFVNVDLAKDPLLVSFTRD